MKNINHSNKGTPALSNFQMHSPSKNVANNMYQLFFHIAGITVCVKSNLNIGMVRFNHEIASFAIDGPGEDNVTLLHHFELPDLTGTDFGEILFRNINWTISYSSGTWFYRYTSRDEKNSNDQHIALFNADHTSATIYSPASEVEYVHEEGFSSLSLFPHDQFWLSHILSERRACTLHAAGVILNEQGLLFVGPSGAGKSTMSGMLQDSGEILSDERIVLRRWDEGFRVHGTWRHSDVPGVSKKSALLQAIFFLQKDTTNQIIPIEDTKQILAPLMQCLIIKSLVDKHWWERVLNVLGALTSEIPCYMVHFDKSKKIVDHIVQMQALSHGSFNRKVRQPLRFSYF